MRFQSKVAKMDPLGVFVQIVNRCLRDLGLQSTTPQLRTLQLGDDFQCVHSGHIHKSMPFAQFHPPNHRLRKTGLIHNAFPDVFNADSMSGSGAQPKPSGIRRGRRTMGRANGWRFFHGFRGSNTRRNRRQGTGLGCWTLGRRRNRQIFSFWIICNPRRHLHFRRGHHGWS